MSGGIIHTRNCLHTSTVQKPKLI